MKHTYNTYKNHIILGILGLMNLYCLILFGQDFGFSVKHSWNDFLNFYPRVLQDVIFFFALISLYKFNFKYLLAIIPLSFIETTTSFINQYIHPLIAKTHIFSLFSSQPENISPEYTRIFLFIGILVLYCFKWFKKKTIYTIFLTLSMIGVLGTAVLFHTITLAQINYYSHEQEKTFKSFVPETDAHVISSQCQLLQVTCTIDPQDQNNIFNVNPPDIIKNYRPIVTSYWDKSPLYFYYTISNDNTSMSRIFSRKPVAFIKNSKWKILIVDDKNYTKYLRFNEVIFGSLSMASHLVWILGALYLIYFHEQRLKRKSINVESKKEDE